MGGITSRCFSFLLALSLSSPYIFKKLEKNKSLKVNYGTQLRLLRRNCYEKCQNLGLGTQHVGPVPVRAKASCGRRAEEAALPGVWGASRSPCSGNPVKEPRIYVRVYCSHQVQLEVGFNFHIEVLTFYYILNHCTT